MKAIESINMQNLKTAVKELNGLELLPANIKIIGVNKQTLVDSFISSVEGISEEDQAELTEGIINFYNDLFAGEEEGAEPDPAPAGEAAATQAKAKKEPKEPKEKKEKKVVEKGPFNSTVGSGANNMDLALIKGGTMEELMASSGCTKSRLNVHMKFLEANRNVVITKAEGDTPVISGALKK